MAIIRDGKVYGREPDVDPRFAAAHYQDGRDLEVVQTDSHAPPVGVPRALLTDDDWQAIADHPRNPLAFIPGRFKALVEERITIARTRGVNPSDESQQEKNHG